KLEPSNQAGIPGVVASTKRMPVEIERRWQGSARCVSSIVLEDGSKITTKNTVEAIEKRLPSLVTVPPLRDIGEELKIGPRASFGKTLRPIIDSVLHDVGGRKTE